MKKNRGQKSRDTVPLTHAKLLIIKCSKIKLELNLIRKVGSPKPELVTAWEAHATWRDGAGLVASIVFWNQRRRLLKGQCHEIFDLCFFSSITST